MPDERLKTILDRVQDNLHLIDSAFKSMCAEDARGRKRELFALGLAVMGINIASIVLLSYL